MEKLFIKNRKNQKICVLIEETKNSKGLVFIVHGLAAFKEQPIIQTFAEAFLEEGFTVVRFDTTNTFGESEGNYEDATVTNYLEDLEDVIGWAKNNEWYKEPFYLTGHSLGGMSIALFAEKNSSKVKGLIPISAVISGALSSDSQNKRGILKKWKETGWRIEESKSRPGLIRKLKWSHMEDRLKYDLLPDAKKLKMPVLLIVGEQDETTPLEHQKMLFDVLPGKKELHVIKGVGHDFDKTSFIEIKQIIKKWIETNF